MGADARVLGALLASSAMGRRMGGCPLIFWGSGWLARALGQECNSSFHARVLGAECDSALPARVAGTADTREVMAAVRRGMVLL